MLYHVTCFVDTEVEADSIDEAMDLAIEAVEENINVELYED